MLLRDIGGLQRGLVSLTNFVVGGTGKSQSVYKGLGFLWISHFA